MPDDITLRSPRPDELHAYMRPLYDAFGDASVPEQIEAEGSIMDLDRFIGAWDGKDWVATAGAYAFRLTVPGGEIAASGITGIGVRPDHRRQGLLRQMLDWLFDDARRRGEIVAILLASEAAIYQRFGFGQGTQSSSFRFETTATTFRAPLDGGSDVRVRMVDVDEAATLFAPIWDRVRPTVPGAIDRSAARWREWLVADAPWMQRGEGIKFRAVLEVDGEPRGYAIYRVENGWAPTGPSSTLNVQEVIAVDAVAEQALWEWLLSTDLIRTIAGRRMAVPHPLQNMLLEPRRMGLNVHDGIYLRLLDLEAALGERRYVGSGTIVLDVTDELFEANAGRWELRVSDGRAAVSRSDAAPDLELDIAALAETYLGAFRFGDLAVAGRVRSCQPGALERADSLFTPPRSPWCSTPF